VVIKFLILFFALLYTVGAAGAFYGAAVSILDNSRQLALMFGVGFTIVALLIWAGFGLIVRAHSKPAGILIVISGILSIPIGLLLIILGIIILKSKKLSGWTAAER